MDAGKFSLCYFKIFDLHQFNLVWQFLTAKGYRTVDKEHGYHRCRDFFHQWERLVSTEGGSVIGHLIGYITVSYYFPDNAAPVHAVPSDKMTFTDDEILMITLGWNPFTEVTNEKDDTQ